MKENKGERERRKKEAKREEERSIKLSREGGALKIKRRVREKPKTLS